MRLLLDTHVWLWATLGPIGKLGRVGADALSDPGNELWLSPVSLWELIVLSAKRRVTLDMEATSWIQKALAELPCSDAPFTSAVALATSEVELDHKDPADRFLAATARAFDLTLATADRQLLNGKGFRTLKIG